RRGFDLTRAPLMRLTIVTRSPSAVEVLWSFHHAILDGRSFPIVLREVFGLYDAIRVGQEIALPPPRQYRAYIDWLQSSGPEDSKEFWRQRLAGFTGPAPILRDVLAGKDEGSGAVQCRLSADETRRLEAFAAEAKCTVGTLLGAAGALLL